MIMRDYADRTWATRPNTPAWNAAAARSLKAVLPAEPVARIGSALVPAVQKYHRGAM